MMPTSDMPTAKKLSVSEYRSLRRAQFQALKRAAYDLYHGCGDMPGETVIVAIKDRVEKLETVLQRWWQE
jgi:hypothetical protein